MKKKTMTMKTLLKAAAKHCAIVEGIPSCATCEHAHPVPDGEGGSERNIYCRAVDYLEFPNGLKMRRTGNCALYHPIALVVETDMMPILRKRYGSRARKMMRKIISTIGVRG